MFYGLYYASFIINDLRVQRLTAMETALEKTNQGQQDAALRWLKQWEITQETADHHSDVHSHLTLFGVIAVFMSMLAGHSSFKSRLLSAVSLLYIGGSFLLPFGVFLETMGSKQTGAFIAVTGGIWTFIAFTAFALSLWRPFKRGGSE